MFTHRTYIRNSCLALTLCVFFVSPANGQIDLISPVGGEAFAADQEMAIVWDSPSDLPTTIQMFNLDQGRWVTIAEAIPAGQSNFIWDLSNADVGERIRLRLVSGSHSVLSEGYVAVKPSSAITDETVSLTSTTLQSTKVINAVDCSIDAEVEGRHYIEIYDVRGVRHHGESFSLAKGRNEVTLQASVPSIGVLFVKMSLPDGRTVISKMQ